MSLGRGRVLAAIAAAVVVLAVGAGLYVAGPPSEARLVGQDRERMRRLWRLQQAIISYREEHGALPTELSVVRPAWRGDSTSYRDPVTAEPFAYQALDDSTYSLCAVFARASEDEDGNLEQSHPAGRHCFTRHLSREHPPH